MNYKIKVLYVLFFGFFQSLKGTEVICEQEIKPYSYAWEGKKADFQLTLNSKNEEGLSYNLQAVFTQKNKKKSAKTTGAGLSAEGLKSLDRLTLVSLKVFACAPPRELFDETERELFKDGLLSLLKNHVSQEICWEEIII